MEDTALKRELFKRIFGNLGAIPNKFGLVGLTLDEYLIDRIEFTEDGEIKEYPIWAGQLENHRLLLTNIGDLSEPELILIYNNTNALKFIWDDINCGILLGRIDKKWRMLGLLELLSFTAAFEIIAQQGILFAPQIDFKEQRLLLTDLIENES